ncbi:MAG: SDR family oxidoreductase [Alphaproteobacteria bacterium]|nr:SDR family oxidoreductase [Alphaproteobacteria bacterium]
MRSVPELFDLAGRSALVTGGAGHLGRAIGNALAECGARVALLDRHDPSAAASKLPAAEGVEHAALTVDLAIEDQVRAAPVEQQNLSKWRDALEVNLTAPFALTQAALSHLRESGQGSVIHIGSIYGMLGPDWSLYDAEDVPGTPAAYAASKGGLMQMTRWLATSLAPDVRVNAIVPGGVQRDTAPRFKAAYEKRTPLGRMASEEDVKGAAAFLASDAASYVTGQCLMVDGGWSAW